MDCLVHLAFQTSNNQLITCASRKKDDLPLSAIHFPLLDLGTWTDLLCSASKYRRSRPAGHRRLVAECDCLNHWHH